MLLLQAHMADAGLGILTSLYEVLPPIMPYRENAKQRTLSSPWEKDLLVDLLFQKEFPTNLLDAIDKNLSQAFFKIYVFLVVEGHNVFYFYVFIFMWC